MITDAAKESVYVGTPARFERVRCAIARRLYTKHRYVHRLSLALVPADHPWKLTVGSTSEALEDVTAATLHARDEDGHPVALPPTMPTRFFRDPAFYAKLAILYAILDASSRIIPGPIGHATDLDDRIRIIHRLTEAGSAFFSG